MKCLSYRSTYFYTFLITLAMLGLAFYLQFYKGITPCPLCILQRIAMIIISFIFLVAIIFKWKKLGNKVFAFLTLVVAIIGGLLAGRQVWLQHLPADQHADCGANLQYMLHVLPLDQVILKIVEGGAECSLVDWTFAGLSLASWSLLVFIFFAGFSIWQICRKST